MENPLSESLYGPPNSSGLSRGSWKLPKMFCSFVKAATELSKLFFDLLRQLEHSGKQLRVALDRPSGSLQGPPIKRRYVRRFACAERADLPQGQKFF